MHPPASVLVQIYNSWSCVIRRKSCRRRAFEVQGGGRQEKNTLSPSKRKGPQDMASVDSQHVSTNLMIQDVYRGEQTLLFQDSGDVSSIPGWGTEILPAMEKPSPHATATGGRALWSLHVTARESVCRSERSYMLQVKPNADK
ncbi:hypothetical protein MJT46_002385 [Ovis ammon polii x Ovis aries]|nr:hypothetical protein MJT46_002385 [Ovis ammon polii x Ovis aries]